MTASLRWWGPPLDSDHQDLADMLGTFNERHQVDLTDNTGSVGDLVGEIAGLGLWTLGTSAEHGGGGADRTATALAWEYLGRSWPSLGWASVQAHVAVDVLAPGGAHAELIDRLHTGTASIAVVSETSRHVRIADSGSRVARIDAAGERPHLLILGTGNDAGLFDPEALSFTALDRTGLGGAFTRTVDFDSSSAGVRIADVDTAAARSRLWAGAATVAAGSALAAAEAAVNYADGRIQFGASLTAISTVRQSLFEQASRAAVAAAAALQAQSELAAAAALRTATDNAVSVAADALQSHGGYGYLTEYGAVRRFADALSLRAAVDPWEAGVYAAKRLAELTSIGAVSARPWR